MLQFLTPSLYGLQYSVVSGICALMLLSFAATVLRLGDRSLEAVNFRASILFSAMGAVMDIPFAMREFMGYSFSPFLCYLTEMLYSASGILSAYCWFVYSEFRQNSRLIRSKGCRVFFSLLMLVLLAGTFTTHLHHRYFYFEDGLYCRGTLNTPVTVLIVLLTVYSGFSALLRSFRKDQYINRHQYRLLFLYSVFIILVQSLQIVLGSIMPFRSVGATAVYMIVTFQGIQQQVTVDSLSHINNRFAMDHYLAGRFERGDSFRLMMLDLDEFKQINDKFGHLQGDKAIALAARVIAHSVPNNAFVGRYGGDEFCVILSCNEQEIRQLEERIQINLTEAAAEEQLPFSLRISTGHALKDASVSNIPDLIKAADQQLYEKKKMRKKSS